MVRILRDTRHVHGHRCELGWLRHRFGLGNFSILMRWCVDLVANVLETLLSSTSSTHLEPHVLAEELGHAHILQFSLRGTSERVGRRQQRYPVVNQPVTVRVLAKTPGRSMPPSVDLGFRVPLAPVPDQLAEGEWSRLRTGAC